MSEFFLKIEKMSAKDPVLTGIGQRLQTIRRFLHINQKDFAREMEVSGASLSEIEAGNTKPRIEIYYNLTRKYHVNMAYLLEGKGEIAANEKEIQQPGIEPAGELRQFMEKFLYYFEKSQVVRYAVMSHFTTFLEEKEALIEKNIKKNKPIK